MDWQVTKVDHEHVISVNNPEAVVIPAAQIVQIDTLIEVEATSMHFLQIAKSKHYMPESCFQVTTGMIPLGGKTSIRLWITNKHPEQNKQLPLGAPAGIGDNKKKFGTTTGGGESPSRHRALQARSQKGGKPCSGGSRDSKMQMSDAKNYERRTM